MSPLFLSHHPPTRYDRCIRVGRHHVCRRCAVLYPLAFAVAIASASGVHWPEPWDRTLLYLLPLPMTLELIIERFGAIRYKPRRQLLLTVLAAPALGRGFARYVLHPGDRLFWGMVALFGGCALLSLILSPAAADAPSKPRRQS
jgi:hypothetical protein